MTSWPAFRPHAVRCVVALRDPAAALPHDSRALPAVQICASSGTYVVISAVKVQIIRYFSIIFSLKGRNFNP